MRVDDYERILDRARLLLTQYPAFGEYSAMSKLVESGISPNLAFFAIRGAQVLEVFLKV